MTAIGRPDLTICVCTRNRPDYLRLCLSGIARQDLERDRFEVLVVDSASDGETARKMAALVPVAPNARLLRLERPGLSAARNAGARAATAPYVAYIDDDAIPDPGWARAILQSIAEATSRPAVLAGRILPIWEQPLPHWWPDSLRGVLSIIETEGCGEFRTQELPAHLEPFGANFVVSVAALLAAGGFRENAGRNGSALLSDEEVQLAWRLQDDGHSARYDSRAIVHHHVQGSRLTPAWLLKRLYWQGFSAVLTRCALGRPDAVRRELPRRIIVAALLGPTLLLPQRSPFLISLRWRAAYTAGFLRAAFRRPEASPGVAGSPVPAAST